MEHYPAERWADYVRGLLDAEARVPLARHLDECASCAREVALLRSVAAAARRHVDVPEPVLAAARAIFPARPSELGSPWHRLTAALAFDSLAALAPAGVRGLASSSRRLTFQADDFELELLLEGGTTPSLLSLTGQITTPGGAALPVLVMSGRTALQQTLANEFGEFHLEFAPRAGLRLAIRDEAGRREIEVPLASVVGLRQNRR